MSDDERRCVWRPDQPCPWRPVGRDAEIVRLVALGKTDYAIGKELALSPYTVTHNIGRLCRMLGIGGGDPGSAARRVQLAAWAGQHGLCGTPEP